MTRLLGVMMSLLLLTGMVRGRGLESEDRVVDAEGAKQLEVSIEFAAGELVIAPADMSDAAKLHVEYDPRQVDYEVDYDLRGSTGVLYMETVRRRHRDIDTDDNRWDLQLSTHYPMELDMDIGACDAEMDFGGLRLTELGLDIGAASGVIEFSKKNPERLRTFSIDAGAASVDVSGIGNSGFQEFDFDGGAGSFELDFRGDNYDGLSEITVDIGLGSCELILPEDIPVRIITDGSGWMSSVDIHGRDLREVDDDIWESDDYEASHTRIAVDLDVGMGSIDIYFR